MKINLGNFGNVAVEVPAQSGRGVPAGAFGTGDALADAGRVVGGVADKMLAEQKAEEKRIAGERDALEKTETMLRWMEHENGLTDAAHDVTNRMRSGQLDERTAADEFDKARERSESAALSAIPAKLHNVTQIKFEGLAGRMKRNLQGTAEELQRGRIVGNLESIRDGMLKQASLAGADPAALGEQFEEAARVLGPQGGLDEGKVGKLVQEFRDTATFGAYKARVIDGLASLKSLQTLEAQIKTDPGLDSDKRLALLSTTQSQIAGLNQRAAIEAERRERSSAKAWQSAVDVVQAGKPLSPDFAASLAQTFKGTPYAKALNELMTQAPQNLAFAAQSLRQQDAALLDMQARGNTAGWSPADRANFEKLDRVHRATLADVKTDPWRAGLDRGVLTAIAPLDASSLDALAASMGNRLKQSDTLTVWTGREVSPLRPEEAQLVGRSLESLPAPMRADMLGKLGKQMKPGQMQALAAQLGDGSLGVAALLASANRRTETGRPVADIYLKGIDAIREKRLTFDEAKQARVREDIRREIEGVYLTESASRTALESAFGIYAGLKADGEGGNVKKAVEIATGGIMSYNGAKIAKPPGWSDRQVKDAVRNVTPERVRNLFGEEVAIGGEKLGADAFAKALPGARLGPSPMPGGYSIIIGGRLATGLDGRALILPLEAR